MEQTREKNHLRSVTNSASASTVVVNGIEVNIRPLSRRIAELLRQAMKLVDRGKPSTIAVRAVMRKLPHAIYGMHQAGRGFDAETCSATPQKVPPTA